MINSIELTNWKTHGSTKLTFTKGTNILIGQMGAGKSSIMDAISFSLFGTFPAIKNRRINVNDIIRSKPEQKKRAAVKLCFAVDKDEYTVERELGIDEPGRAKLEKNNAYVQSQPQRVTEEIEKILKMDYDLFSRAVYSEQNRLDYFLELRSFERKRQIDNLLGLDKFSNAQENTTSLINKIKEMIGEGEKTAKGFDIKRLKEGLLALNKELEKLSKDKTEIEERLMSLDSREKETASKLKAMKERYSRKIGLNKETAELKSKLDILESEIGKIDAKKLGSREEVQSLIESVGTQLSELRKLESKTLNTLQDRQLQIGKFKNMISDMERKIIEKNRLAGSTKSAEKSKIAESIERCSSELELAEKEIARNAAMKSESDRWIGELEKHLNKCPVCEREFSEEVRLKLLSSKKYAIEEFGQKLKEATELRDKKRKEINELNSIQNKLLLIEEKLTEYSTLEVKLAEAKKSAEGVAEEARAMASDRESYSDRIAKLGEEVARLKAAKDALERKASYLIAKERIAASISDKAKELGLIEVNEDELDSMQKEFVEVSSQISRFKASLEAGIAASKEKSRQIKDREEEIDRIEKLYEAIKIRKATLDDLSKFKNAMQETQAILRNRLINSINEIMQDIWPELYPYGDYPSIAMAATEDDYILRVYSYRDGTHVWENVESTASGGERSIACLAMRIAFALVLVPNLRWLILDEPTHNIDQQGLNKFVRVFNEILPSIVDQIFIITHDEQLKQVSNGKVYLLSRNKEENRETIVEEI